MTSRKKRSTSVFDIFDRTTFNRLLLSLKDMEDDAECGKSEWKPPTQIDGLYDPAQEKEACGVGFVVQIDGIRSNKVNRINCCRTFMTFCLMFTFIIDSQRC